MSDKPNQIVTSQIKPVIESSVKSFVVDAKGLGNILGISLRHVRRLDILGKLPTPIRIGRCVRWYVREIDDWLAAGAPNRDIWKKMKSHESNEKKLARKEEMR